MGTKIMQKAASYLIRRATTYYFRFQFPASVAKKIGRKEIRLSLGTGKVWLARKAACHLLPKVQSLCDPAMTKEQINSAIDGIVQNCAKSFVEKFYSSPTTVSDSESNIVALQEALKASNTFIRERRFDEFTDMTVTFAKNNGIDVQPGTVEFNQLTLKLLRMFEEATNLKIKMEAGEIEAVESRLETPALPMVQAISQHPKRERKFLLNDLVAKYIEYKKFNPSSGKNIIPVLHLFVETMNLRFGKLYDGDLDHEHTRTFMELISKYPAHARKRYKDASLEELFKMKDAETISPSTQGDYYSAVNTFFKWMTKTGYIPINFMDGKEPIVKEEDKNERYPFSLDNLSTIFTCQEYLEDTFSYPYQFWLPILGLYTGARLNELCQLYVADVKKQNGIVYLDINSDALDKSLKKKDSKRLVPLHPFISEKLKFYDYIQSLKTVRVFDELKFANDSYGHNASKWFARFRKKYNLVHEQDGIKLVYHSFRNTVANKFLRQGVMQQLAERFVGHALTGMTYGTYSKDCFRLSNCMKKAL